MQPHLTTSPELDGVWLRPGQRAVFVEPAVGPWRGGEIVSVEALAGSYETCLRQIRAMPQDTLCGFTRSVTSAIRVRMASETLEDLSPENDSALMGDLLLLGALREVVGETVLRETGMARLSVLSSEPAKNGTGLWRTQVGMAH